MGRAARRRPGTWAFASRVNLEYPWDPEGGFVRRRIADQQLPCLAGVVWPDGTRFQTLYSVGDTSNWEGRYFVTSTASADEILALVAADIDGEKDWAREGEAHAWLRDINGQRKRLAFGTSAGEGGFIFWYTLK